MIKHQMKRILVDDPEYLSTLEICVQSIEEKMIYDGYEGRTDHKLHSYIFQLWLLETPSKISK